MPAIEGPVRLPDDEVDPVSVPLLALVNTVSAIFSTVLAELMVKMLRWVGEV